MWWDFTNPLPSSATVNAGRPALRSMRRLLFLILVASALLVLVPGRAAAQTPTFVFSGHGFGHGVGMPQYGAYGYAQHGWTYDRILGHFYQGTTLGQTKAAKIRVLLAAGRSSVTIGSDGDFSVRDAAGAVVQIPAGTVTLGPDLRLTVGGKQSTLVSPLQFMPGKQPLRFDRAYRGWLVVTLSDGKLVVVNRVGLEPYVQGVVAGEMPASWSAEALKAQAVAARSYALASRRSGGLFDVFADTRSQVYRGLSGEDPRTNAAVAATKRQVVLYDGKIATTYFSSSSGGRTAAVEDGFAGASPVPYLVSVDDPYDTISPYHDWGPIAFTADELRQKLGDAVPADLVQLQVETNPSGRVATLTAVGAGGETAEFSGFEVRSKLGLRSTWFTVETVGLTPSARRIVYGQDVKLRGVVQGPSEVAIEHRPSGGEWTKLATVSPGRDGKFTVKASPSTTTWYRLRTRGPVGKAVRVQVAPRLTLEAVRDRVLRGRLQPARPGVTITIQRRTSSGWKDVATALTAKDGSFRTQLRARPGQYRARVDPLPGLTAGVSRTVRMVGG
jgi:stage II sporulation protein D